MDRDTKPTRRINEPNSEKAGFRTGFAVLQVVTVPKTRKQNRNNRQQQKANKPNNKQKPPKAKKGIVKVPAQSKKGDDLCIAVERQYGVKH